MNINTVIIKKNKEMKNELKIVFKIIQKRDWAKREFESNLEETFSMMDDPNVNWNDGGHLFR